MRAWLADLADDTRSFLEGPMGRRAAIRWARSPIAAIPIILIALALYLPGLFTIPTVDRDEARFAQASRQMFESLALPEDEQTELHEGGLVIPKVGGENRLNKPPLIYWLQTTAVAALTGGDPSADAIWMYRVPSVLCAVITALVTWRLGTRMFDPRAALLAALLIAACPMILWDANQARADQLLVAATTLALAALWPIWKGRAKPAASGWKAFVRPALLWLAIALGVYAKGPITPMIVLLTALTLSLMAREWRWWGRLKPIFGLIVVVATVAPWVIAVAARVGFSEYASLIFDETIGRSASPKEGHWGPPGYHLLLLPLLFWPGSLLTAVAITRAFKRALTTRTPIPMPDPSSESSVEPTLEPTPQPAPEPEPESKPEPETKHAPIPPEPQAEEPTDPNLIPLAPEEEPIEAPSRFDPTKAPPTDEPESKPEDDTNPSFATRVRALVFTLRHRAPGRDAELFLLCWVVPSWLVFELIGTKLPHYTLPLYPALALLSARAVFAAAAGVLRSIDSAPAHAGYWIWVGLGFAITAAAPIAFAILSLNPLLAVPAILAAAIAALAVWLARNRLRASHFIEAQLLGLAAMLIGAWALLQFALPAFKSPWLTQRITDLIPEGTEIIASAGYHEDSLVFATRGSLIKIAEDEASTWARRYRGPAAVLIAPAETEEDALASGLELERLGIVSGFNYSTGKPTRLAVFRLGRAAPQPVQQPATPAETQPEQAP